MAMNALRGRIVLYLKKTRLCPSYERLPSLIRQGLESWELPDQLLDAASSNKPSTIPDVFFFYGTLLRGESRFHVLHPLE